MPPPDHDLAERMPLGMPVQCGRRFVEPEHPRDHRAEALRAERAHDLDELGAAARGDRASGPLRRPWRLVWRKEVNEAAMRLLRVLEKAAPRVTHLPPARAPRERLRA